MKTSLSTPIAEGRTADVYAWDDTHILKLYRDWCPSDWVDHEARVARAIAEAEAFLLPRRVRSSKWMAGAD